MPELRRRHDSDAAHLLQRQQILITCNQQIGVNAQHEPQNGHIVRITTGGIPLRIRRGIVRNLAHTPQPMPHPPALSNLSADLTRQNSVNFPQDVIRNEHLAQSYGFLNHFF